MERRAFAFIIPFPEAGRMLQAGPDIDQETSLCFPGWLIQVVEDSPITDKRNAPLLATPRVTTPNKKDRRKLPE